MTFENGLVNLIDADAIEQLTRLVTRIEESPAVTVVVFGSANPEYFMAHWDLKADRTRVAAMAPGPTGLHPYLDNLVRLSKVPAVTISAIRGRARGAGSEFMLATDIRFAGDKAILGHFEMGLGSVPPTTSPPSLPNATGTSTGCSRTLGLHGFVDAFARRIAGFDKAAVAGTKALLDWASLPPDEEFGPGLAAFFRTSGCAENGLQTPAGVELDLGRAVGEFACSMEPWLG